LPVALSTPSSGTVNQMLPSGPAAVRLAYDRAAGQNRDAGDPGACMDTIDTHSKPDPHGVAACVADG
jgi:hypothetical protein